jgi:arylsulfatase B
LAAVRASLLAGLCALAGCGGGDDPSAPAPQRPANLLVIVLDDIGVDKIAAYGEHPLAPPTPNIDALAANGVLFRRAHAQPWCSPSRACLLTGRYAYRTGIGNPISQTATDASLADDEITLPEVLELARPGAIARAAIGKWHLASTAMGDLTHANRQGFEWFEGTPGNFGGQSYYQHNKLTNGALTTSSTYATTEQVDDALARIDQLREPWFLYLGFNAAHEPFHAPPAELHGYSLSGAPEDAPFEHFSAAVEALDREIGRLLAGLPPEVRANTNIVLLGDNGTPGTVIVPPWRGPGKGSTTQTGIRVPLVVCGPDVAQPGREVDALVHVVDLFATCAELLDVDAAAAMPDARAVDSLSFADVLRDPLAQGARTRIYADSFSPNGPGPYNFQRRALSDGRWKLVETVGAADRLFDLANDPFEDDDLMLSPAMAPEAQSAYDALKLELAAYVDS